MGWLSMTIFNPYFTTGLPGLSATVSNNIAKQTQFVQEARDPTAASPFGFNLPNWMGFIISTTVLGPNRWNYRIQKINLTATPANVATNTAVHLDLSAYVTPATDVPAYNLWEYQALATGLLADGTPIANIPAGLTVQPVRGVVMVYQWLNSEGTVIFVFDRPNGLGGTCG
jgi:hypothetical protein